MSSREENPIGAKRYSGHTTISVTIVPAPGMPHGEQYKVSFARPPHGQTSPVTGKIEIPTAPGARATQYVGMPAHLSKAIDSSEAYDDAARAGVSFLLDEQSQMIREKFDESDFEWGDKGVVVHRQPQNGRRGNPMEERESNPRERTPIDEDAATELLLFADNESTLYPQKLAIIANLQKKKRKGEYDAALAPKLWLYWIDAAAKQYVKEFGGGVWSHVFPKPTREHAAKEIAERESRAIDGGEYEERKGNPIGDLPHLTREQRERSGMPMQPKEIDISGRRWFQKTYGNTYFTATIAVNGKEVAKIGPSYGYGDHYLTEAFDWLALNGFIDFDRHSLPPTRWARENGITLNYNVTDVPRQKDL